MATYVKVPDPLLNVGKPGRSLDWKQFRDNQEAHEERLRAVEDPGIRFFSHMAEANFGSNNVIAGIYRASAAAPAGTASWTRRIESATDEHFERLTVNLGALDTGGGHLAGLPAFHFTNRVKPLTFEARCKPESFSFWAAMRIGFVGETLPSMTAATRPNNGVILEIGGAANTWRFTSMNGGVNTLGTDFAKVANGTWFACKIVFTDNPSNQALCYIDGVLKETITTNLPTAKNLFGCASIVASGNTGGTITLQDVDRMEGKAAGAISNAA